MGKAGRRRPAARGARIRASVLVLASTVAGGAVAAQVPGVATAAPPGARSSRTFDTGDGLSHNVAFSIHQDRWGFLWVGTIDGLNRFDGREFTIYRHDPDDPDSLSNSTVRQIWEGPDGDLWLRTAVGLDRLVRRTGTFRRYPVEVHQLVFDSSGNPRVAGDAGLYDYDAATDSFVVRTPFPLDGLDSPSSADPVWGLIADGAGTTWLGTQEGELFEIEPGGGVRQHGSPWEQLILLGREADGVVTIGHGSGVGRFEPATGGFAAYPGSGGVTGVLSAHLAADGTLWLGGERLYRLERDRVVEVDSGSRAPLSTPIWDILDDREGALWLATPRGIRVLDPFAAPIRVLRHDPADGRSLSGDSVSALAADGRGGLWVGTLDGGLDRVDLADGSVRRQGARIASPASPCGGRIWALLAGDDGDLWVGSGNGLCVLDPTGLLPISLAPAGEPEPVVFALVRDRSGAVWAGGSAGLARIDARSRTIRRVDPLGPARAGRVGVEGLLLASDGSLWVGTSRSDLVRIDPSGKREDFALGDDPRLQGSEGFWSLVERPDGGLWLGGDRGLFRFDPEHAAVEPHRVSERLASPAVFSAAIAGEHLWLATQSGLLRVDQGPLSGDVAARRYGVEDGLPEAELNRRAVATLPDGRLAFGGMGGVSLLDPARIRGNPHPPPVVVTSVERLRRDGPVIAETTGIDSVELAHDDSGLRIRYAALTFSGADPVHAYRLEGFDPDWVPAGVQREARYPALAPGAYRFVVRAANADGVWSPEGASIALVVSPPWWATTGFRLFAGGALLLALVAAVRQVSTHRLRRRVRELEIDRQVRLERERISRDLHDNVGSQVSTILAGIEIAQLDAHDADAEHVARALEALREDARRTMTQLRETVWSLHQDRVRVADLVERIREHLAERQRVAEGVALGVEASGALDTELRSGHALHLFRVVQEAVSNAIRHAAASRVRVSLDVDGSGRLTLAVRDDGAFRAPAAHHRGFGLRGMEARAAQIGARLSLETGDGTTVRLDLPAG